MNEPINLSMLKNNLKAQVELVNQIMYDKAKAYFDWNMCFRFNNIGEPTIASNTYSDKIKMLDDELKREMKVLKQLRKEYERMKCDG